MTSQNPPAGLKGKANAVATDLFMKAPPSVQNGLLNGIGKAQPLVAKAKPYGKQIAGGVLGLAVLRRRRRKRA